jgi:Probable lipoprotein LpqN
MKQTARTWRVTVAGLAVGAAGVLGLASPTASADPVFPPHPNPAPAAPMPQAVAIVPGAVGNPMPGTAAAAPAPILPAQVPAVPAPPPVAAPPELAPASSGTLREFLASKNVKLEPQQAKDFKALDLTLPMPQGWTQVPDPNVPDAFVVTANRHSSSLYTPNAQLVVYRLVGDFDPKEAITHGYLDNQQMPTWRTTNASLGDFNGSPSSIIEGTYRQNEMTLNTSHRNVIVTAGPDRYLVSLAVTTEAGATVGEAPATDGIINGFRAGPPGSSAPAAPPPAPAAPAPPAAPAAPPAVVAPPQALSH